MANPSSLPAVTAGWSCLWPAGTAGSGMRGRPSGATAATGTAGVIRACRKALGGDGRSQSRRDPRAGREEPILAVELCVPDSLEQRLVGVDRTAPVPGRGDDAAGVAADADGPLQLFLLDSWGGHLYQIGQVSGSNGWSGWQDHRPPNVANLAGPVTATRSGDGRIEVFAIGTNSSLRNVRQTAPSSAYSGWNAYGNPGVGLQDRPALARSADGRLELFVRGQDGLLYHQWQTAVGTFSWSGWNSFDAASTPDKRFTDPPVVAPGADGRLELFLRSGDGNMYHAWQTSASNGWSDWVNKGTPGGGFITAAPGLARNGDGRLEIFAVANDRNIYHKWQTAASNGWRPWTLLAPQDPSLITTVPDLIGPSVALAQQQIQAAQLHLTAHGPGN
jgi:hypothetical protein